MEQCLKKLLVNLKNYPWEHYPSYKIDEHDGKELIEALQSLEEKETKKKRKSKGGK